MGLRTEGSRVADALSKAEPLPYLVRRMRLGARKESHPPLARRRQHAEAVATGWFM